ncbi:hypothetical protein HDU84_003742 [Entophlyctis sp. JEL0112]|nr:hypothetical protein HDU84_003742 [Entophlyctis sp. JEL0112]
MNNLGLHQSPALSATSDASLEFEPPVSLTHIKRAEYTRQTWKNGLGETEEIAISPRRADYYKDEFVWRFSETEVRDSCTFSVCPGYDVAVMMLPSASMKNGVDDDVSHRLTFASLHKKTLAAPALLRHNDQSNPVPFRVLAPYTYQGELPTTCYVKDSATRHLTFIANRNLTSVTVGLETICPHGLDDEGGVCDGEGDGETPVPSPMIKHHKTPQEIHKSNLILPSDASSQLSVTLLNSSRDVSPSRHIPHTSPTTKILLNAITIVYVVSGSIHASVNGESKSVMVNTGETLIIERDEDSAPTDFSMSPVVETSKDLRSILKKSQDAMVFIAEVHLKKPVRNESVTSASVRESQVFQGPLTESTFQLYNGVQTMSPKLSAHRAGSIVVYDDDKAKSWESARHYRPPTFSARHQNESDVPPAVVADELVIDDFPVGKISTVWINMVKEGLSEWIRVPVIVARGVNPGPVLGITAVVHGNELNGVPCIHRVITDVDVFKLTGTVVAVPCVNVPGYLRFSREFSDGKDLNRLFPGSSTGTASQIYAHAILNKICIHFDYLIDLHTASFGRVNSYYVRSDMNDPVGSAMAKLQQPQIILHNSGQDGTLRSACSARGIKAITVEIGNPQLFQNQYVQWSYMGVMRIMTYFGMFPSIDSVDPPLPSSNDTWMDPENLTRHMSTLNIDDPASGTSAAQRPPNTIICSRGYWIYTRTGGVLEVYPAVNTIIKKGALIARIKNIFGNIVDEIFSPGHGVTIGRSSNPVAMAGDRVLHLGVLKKENEVLMKEAKENY